MNFTTLIVAFVIVALALLVQRARRRVARRTLALEAYATRLPLDDAKYIHDLAIAGLVSVGEVDADKLGEDLEIAIALRNRVDELEGRSFGSANRVRIRPELARCASSLLREKVASRTRFDASAKYTIDKVDRTRSREEEERLLDHYTRMTYVYRSGIEPIQSRTS
jgi:hypothetical protein